MEPQQNQPLYTPQMTPPTSAGGKKIGPIIAILVVVIIIIVGAVYLFASNVNVESVPINTDTASSADDVPTQTTSGTGQAGVPLTNTADDLQSIQRDLDQATANVGAETI